MVYYSILWHIIISVELKLEQRFLWLGLAGSGSLAHPVIHLFFLSIEPPELLTCCSVGT